MWRRMPLSSRPSMLHRSLPSNRTVPAVGRYSCSMHRPVVVLPHPLSPTSPDVSPPRTHKPERPSWAKDEANVIGCLDVPDGALDEDARGDRKIHFQVLHLDKHLVSRLGLDPLHRCHAACSFALDSRVSAAKQADK